MKKMNKRIKKKANTETIMNQTGEENLVVVTTYEYLFRTNFIQPSRGSTKNAEWHNVVDFNFSSYLTEIELSWLQHSIKPKTIYNNNKKNWINIPANSYPAKSVRTYPNQNRNNKQLRMHFFNDSIYQQKIIHIDIVEKKKIDIKLLREILFQMCFTKVFHVSLLNQF